MYERVERRLGVLPVLLSGAARHRHGAGDEPVGTAGHDARVALLGDEIVAAARYDVVSPGVAEVAFVVADEHQGRGVGTLLLEHLAVLARAQGIHTFAADTLPNNAKMLGMFAAAGWARESRFEDGTVRTRFSIEPSAESTAAIAGREHIAEAASMARLLAPRTVAVIGASREPGKIGYAVMQNVLRQGFRGVVYPVNPTASSIAGVPAYASVLDIPEPCRPCGGDPARGRSARGRRRVRRASRCTRS